MKAKRPRRGGLSVTSDLTNGAVGGHSGGVEVAEYVELRVGWEIWKWRLKFGEKGKKLCGRTTVSPTHVTTN